MIVADTSVIIKTVVPENYSDTARRLRDHGMAAPSLWKSEAGNVLWRKQQAKTMSQSYAAYLLDLLLKAPIISLSFEEDVQPALSIAAELEHPIYDCFFL